MKMLVTTTLFSAAALLSSIFTTAAQSATSNLSPTEIRSQCITGWTKAPAARQTCNIYIDSLKGETRYDKALCTFKVQCSNNNGNMLLNKNCIVELKYMKDLVNRNGVLTPSWNWNYTFCTTTPS